MIIFLLLVTENGSFRSAYGWRKRCPIAMPNTVRAKMSDLEIVKMSVAKAIGSKQTEGFCFKKGK